MHGNNRLRRESVSYFYTHDYHVKEHSNPPLVIHARVYAIADKYSVPLLKTLAQQNLAVVLNDVKDVKTFDIPTFVAAVSVIYNTTGAKDRSLRDAIIPTLVKYKQALRNNESFTGMINAGLGEGDFALDVIDAWAGLGARAGMTDPISTNRFWRCSNCMQWGQEEYDMCPYCGNFVTLG